MESCGVRWNLSLRWMFSENLKQKTCDSELAWRGSLSALECWVWNDRPSNYCRVFSVFNHLNTRIGLVTMTALSPEIKAKTQLKSQLFTRFYLRNEGRDCFDCHMKVHNKMNSVQDIFTQPFSRDSTEKAPKHNIFKSQTMAKTQIPAFSCFLPRQCTVSSNWRVNWYFCAVKL